MKPRVVSFGNCNLMIWLFSVNPLTTIDECTRHSGFCGLMSLGMMCFGGRLQASGKSASDEGRLVWGWGCCS